MGTELPLSILPQRAFLNPEHRLCKQNSQPEAQGGNRSTSAGGGSLCPPIPTLLPPQGLIQHTAFPSRCPHPRLSPARATGPSEEDSLPSSLSSPDLPGPCGSQSRVHENLRGKAGGYQELLEPGLWIQVQGAISAQGAIHLSLPHPLPHTMAVQKESKGKGVWLLRKQGKF